MKKIEWEIRIRAAEERDIDDTFRLTTQEHVRSASFSSGEITLSSHREWFLQKLSDSSHLFLVAELEGVFIGQVRFDINDDEADISISIVDSFCGMGAGPVIFAGALKSLASLHPEVLLISAYIKNENSVSISFFSRLGFKYTGQAKIKDIDALQYRLNVREEE